MKLSTKARYGTRAMAELGAAYPKGTLSARKVGERLYVSVKYLEQIMSALKAAGLIKAVRGVNGGYALARPPSEITLLEVFRVLEGTPIFVECLQGDEQCPIESTCPTREVWREMNASMEAILEGETVQDLVDRKRHREDAQARMYHI